MSALKSTALEQWHIEKGAKMVPFAGYNMPVQYPLGVLKEHLHTRQLAGLFDVSHMGQIIVTGEQCAKVLEEVFPADLENLEVGQQCYSLLLSDNGTVVDDLMICRRPEDFMLVVNAGCKDKDFDYLKKLIGDRVQLTLLSDQALLALQGPGAAAVLQQLGADIEGMFFMQGRQLTIAGIECWATRSGYTGEDGFEISVSNHQVASLAQSLMAEPAVEAIGLGARDSLRLEAGLCLYGHELNEQTTAIEANLVWAIHKSRRKDGQKAGGFMGSDVILSQIEQGVARQRVALISEGRAPIREGTQLFNVSGDVVGTVTSGGYGPSIEKPVLMAFVDKAFCALETELFAAVRKKKLPVSISKTPFVPNNYVRG